MKIIENRVKVIHLLIKFTYKKKIMTIVTEGLKTFVFIDNFAF